MKNLLTIIILSLILISCKNEVEINKYEFNLKEYITDFKNKITELDTIKIWFNHSICTYQGVELIEITRKHDLLKIRSEYKEDNLYENQKWKLVYEKQIPTTDTI